MPSDDDRRRRWRGEWGPPWAGGGAGHRPPWWPEGEAWPPRDPRAWHGMRRRFMRRAAGFALVAMLFLASLIVLLAWLLGTLLGEEVLAVVLPAIGVLLGLLVAVRLARGIGRAAAPLGDLVEASARVEAGEVGTQVEVRGPGEIRALARAFNAMSARLAEDTEQRRRLLADVSHELRTPITVIQGTIEGMLDGLYPADAHQLERLLAETRQMERLIEDLRTLALSDAGALPLRREPTDLGDLALDVASSFEAAASGGQVELRAEADDVPLLDVDPLRIRQVMGNLVSNALRHTPAGGRVLLAVRRTPDAVLLEVADTGSGMAPEAAARAFDRFWRAGEQAGAGLGLAIVRDLVRAHGGSVDLESSPGAGTTVRCRFPLGG